MGHFAKVLDGVVIRVISAEPEFFDTFVDSAPGDWIQTSYNTYHNVHYLPNSRTPSGNPPVRGNYAGRGFIYDRVNDVFYPPKPYPSWTLDTSIWDWVAPIPEPTDGGIYQWDESTQSWNKLV